MSGQARVFGKANSSKARITELEGDGWNAAIITPARVDDNADPIYRVEPMTGGLAGGENHDAASGPSARDAAIAQSMQTPGQRVIVIYSDHPGIHVPDADTMVGYADNPGIMRMRAGIALVA